MFCMGLLSKSSGKRTPEIPVNFPLFDWAAYIFITAIDILSLRFANRNHSNAIQTQSFQIAARCIGGALCDLPEPHDLRGETHKVGILRIFPRINWMYHEDLIYWASGRPYKEPRLANVNTDLKAGSRTDETFSRHQMFETMTKRTPRQSLQHTTMCAMGKFTWPLGKIMHENMKTENPTLLRAAPSQIPRPAW